MAGLRSMLDVSAVSGFPGKLFHIGEAALNGPAADQDRLKAKLDRIDAALARIAHAIAHAGANQMAADPVQSGGAAPGWPQDVTERIDGLIGELRRALSGEQS